MFPKYEVPSPAGISRSVGGGTFLAIQEKDTLLSSLADAMKAAEVFQKAGYPATLSNAATEGNDKYEGLASDSPYQPWVIKGIPFPGYAGWMLGIWWGPNDVNGGGRDNPGTWLGVGSGNPKYVPAELPKTPDKPPVFNPNDTGVFATLQGATSAATAQSQVSEIYRLVKEMAGKQGIK